MERILKATLRGDVKSLTRILDSDPNLRLDDARFTSFRRTPLHIAAIHGDVEFAEAILRLSPQLASVIDSQGFTPLHLASTRNNITLVRVLLHANKDACTTPDQDGRTPLHLAAMRDKLKVMELLMENNPDAIFQVQNDREQTILHLCVKHDKLEALKKLIDYLVYAPGPNSISVNSRDIDGNTILHLATERRQMKTVKYLLQSDNLGVEINILNNKNLKALQILAQNEMDDIELGYSYHLGGVEQKTSNNQGPNERVNVLMVVAILIGGIAFQAAMNPPGGVFQDDSKVDSNIDPLIFTYYVRLMGQDFVSFSGGGNSTTETNSRSFIGKLLRAPSNPDGLILEEDNMSNIVSDYNSSNSGSGARFYPYLIRYAGTSILAYRFPSNYDVYMTSTALAFLLSLSIIILVVAGAIRDQSVSQVRFLSLLMLVSIGCIIICYISVSRTMSPPFQYPVSPLNLYSIIMGSCAVISMSWKSFLTYLYILVKKFFPSRGNRRSAVFISENSAVIWTVSLAGFLIWILYMVIALLDVF